MKANEILKKIMTELSVVKVEFEMQNLKNGTTLEAEAFEAGNEVFIVTEEDRIALPVGEYEMEDGRLLVVAEEGLIAEVKEAAASEDAAPAEEQVTDAPAAEPAADVQMEDQVPTEEAAPVAEEVAPEAAITEDRIREIVAEEIAKIMQSPEAAPEEPAAEVEVEMSAHQPAAKPIKHAPDAGSKRVDLGSAKSANTTLDRVLAKLNK